MPATEHSFNTVDLPVHLYVDTDFLIACLIATQPHHQRCSDFMVRLLRRDSTTLYLSSLSWMELAHFVLRADFRDRQPPDIRRQYRLDQWENPDVRTEWLFTMISRVEAMLQPFDWNELSLTSRIRRTAIGYMAGHNLGAHDAVHLASAVAAGVADLASLDRGFRRVEGINLWNDRIHTAPPV